MHLRVRLLQARLVQAGHQQLQQGTAFQNRPIQQGAHVQTPTNQEPLQTTVHRFKTQRHHTRPLQGRAAPQLQKLPGLLHWHKLLMDF